MIPELGHVALIIAFGLAIGLTVVPFWGSMRANISAMNLAPSLAVGILVFTAIAFALLAISFLRDDFSVAVVAANSNSLLPPLFKFSALWGNHEGSLLLWVLILAGWMTAVAFLSRGLPLVMIARVLSVMGLIAVGFLAFSLLTSNPFERLLPNMPADGSDLNPLLQDPGLIIHPPLLYMGYVGLSVPFAFAIAALIGGRLDASWARWSRPWTNVAWGFLTLGIMLGSWWAYYELGWGGWWFWDPVGNASLMPLLLGTALVHSLAVTEKRGVFRSWTVLLAIFAFSLSLLGTFLVRSGVLTSVHAFAADPERGLFILVFLALVVGGSLLLYALRAPTVASRVEYAVISRESLLMVNKLVFTVAATLGTTQEKQVKQFFPNAKYKIVEAPARDFQEVLAGRADAHITSNVEAYKLVAKYPEMMVVPVSAPKAPTPIAMLLPQADQVWINYVNTWIALKTERGFFAELGRKWQLSN